MCRGKSRDPHFWSLVIRKPGRLVNASIQDIKSANEFWEVFPVGDVTPEKCLITPLEANMRPETEMTQLFRSYANNTKV